MEIFDPRKLNINFVSKFKTFTTLAGLFCLLSLFLLFKPGLNYGIDFRGGIEAHIAFEDKNVTSKMVNEMLSQKMANFTVVEVEGQDKREFLLTIQEEDVSAFSKVLTETLKSKYLEGVEVLQLDSVGPKVGADLKKSALLSVFYTCLLVCVYLYFRFDFRYLPGALLSTFHDILATVGFMILLQLEFSTTSVAALLTLAGYSINDTVVVFDRIRETENKVSGVDRAQLLNQAINSTLSRTVLTSFTTLISCAVLFVYGGDTLRSFSAALFFGVVSGTFSSIFIAVPCYILSDKLIKKSS